MQASTKRPSPVRGQSLQNYDALTTKTPETAMAPAPGTFDSSAVPFTHTRRAPRSPARSGTASDHFLLSMQHLCHAITTAVTGPPDPSKAQALEEEEEEDEEVRRARDAKVFLPTDKWKETWDLVVLQMIIYSAVMVPYRICFDSQATGIVELFEQTQSMIFFIDVIFNFNTAYPEGDHWVVSRGAIAARYMQGWFWIDFPSCIPVELVDSLIAGEQSELGMLRFLRLFRLLRLLKLLRLAAIVAELEDRFDLNLSFLRIVQMLLALIFLAHILACFWFYTAAIVGLDPDTHTWVSQYQDGFLLDEVAHVRYLTAMYWALTTLTTVGYGDIVAVNDAERAYAILALLIGALVFGYMLSSIAVLVAALDRQGGLSEERMDEIKEYMRWRKLPRELTVRMRKYYDNYFHQRTAFDEASILNNLTPSMRLEVVQHVLKDTIGRIPLFMRTLDPKMQVEIFPLFKPIAAIAREVLFQRGDLALSMYILLKGQVEAVSSLDHRSLYRVRPRQFFGTSVITGRRRAATHRAVTASEMFTISADDLFSIFQKYPHQGKLLYQSILRQHKQREKLRSMSLRMFIVESMSPTTGERMSHTQLLHIWAMRLQLAWEKACADFAYDQMPEFGNIQTGLGERTSGRIVAPKEEDEDAPVAPGSASKPKSARRMSLRSPKFDMSQIDPALLQATPPQPQATHTPPPAAAISSLHHAGLHSGMQDLQRDVRLLIEQVASLNAKVGTGYINGSTNGHHHASVYEKHPAPRSLAAPAQLPSPAYTSPTGRPMAPIAPVYASSPLASEVAGERALRDHAERHADIRAESSLASLHSPRCTSPRQYMARVAQERASSGGSNPSRSVRG